MIKIRRFVVGIFVGLFIGVNCHAQSFLTNGLVAYYPFNGNANDASGNGNNGTIYGGVVLASDRFGNPNSAYAFNGVNGYIDIGNPVGNNPVYLTESCWVAMNSLQTATGAPSMCTIITKRKVDGDSWATLGFIPGGPTTGTGAIAADASFHYNPCAGTIQIPTNVWVSICGVFSNGTYQIYVNGSLENTINDGTALNSDDDMVLMYEAPWSTGEYTGGVLNDVRIYNRALSSSEVSQLYAIESDKINITSDLTNSYVVNGQNTTMSVTASGTSPLSYQWYFVPADNSG